MKEKKPTGMAAFLNLQPARTFDDDSIIGITLQERGGKSVDVTDCVDGTVLRWEKPAGEWTLCVCGKTRPSQVSSLMSRNWEMQNCTLKEM